MDSNVRHLTSKQPQVFNNFVFRSEPSHAHSHILDLKCLRVLWKNIPSSLLQGSCTISKPRGHCYCKDLVRYQNLEVIVIARILYDIQD